jgi:hypothetical protein
MYLLMVWVGHFEYKKRVIGRTGLRGVCERKNVSIFVVTVSCWEKTYGVGMWMAFCVGWSLEVVGRMDNKGGERRKEMWYPH